VIVHVSQQPARQSMDVTTVAPAASMSVESCESPVALMITIGTPVQKSRAARGINAGIGRLAANVTVAEVAASARIRGHGYMTRPPAAT
jgi:hypothetical protein